MQVGWIQIGIFLKGMEGSNFPKNFNVIFYVTISSIISQGNNLPGPYRCMYEDAFPIVLCNIEKPETMSINKGLAK